MGEGDLWQKREIVPEETSNSTSQPISRTPWQIGTPSAGNHLGVQNVIPPDPLERCQLSVETL
jgi:hypothetical protein